MSRVIFLDSGPLSLLTHRLGVPQADSCRAWMAQQLSIGAQLIVPEIVDYELRRELLRARKLSAVSRLNAFNSAAPGRFYPLTTPVMQLAAELWADIRQRGLPTSDPRELDVDVILAAQVLGSGISQSDLIVATTNPAHLARFVSADLWVNIQ